VNYHSVVKYLWTVDTSSESDMGLLKMTTFSSDCCGRPPSSHRTSSRYSDHQPEETGEDMGPCAQAGLWGCLLLLLLLTTASPAAGKTLVIDADAQYRFAQGRYDAGHYREAVAEFERFAFFFPDDTRVPLAKWRIANALYQLGRFTNAVAQLGTLIGADAVDPNLRLKAQLLVSQCLARMGQSGAAAAHLGRLAATAADPAEADELRYQLGWLYLETDQWDRAGEQFDRIHPSRRVTYRLDGLENALEQRHDLPRKDPTVAGTLAVLPGAGYLYCGRPRDAAVALAVNAALFIGAWEAFDSDQEALGALLGVVGIGFYSGSIYGTVASAHKTNQDEIERFRKRLEKRYRVKVLAGGHRIGLQFSMTFD
jgi:tetratricopeptide (TPR) repeat protein